MIHILKRIKPSQHGKMIQLQDKQIIIQFATMLLYVIHQSSTVPSGFQMRLIYKMSLKTPANLCVSKTHNAMLALKVCLSIVTIP